VLSSCSSAHCEWDGLAAFIPTPVMRGFIEGLVCVTIIGQVPHLLGISGTSGNFFTKLWFVLRHLARPYGDAIAAPLGAARPSSPIGGARGHNPRWPAWG
jgi:hypothetical protein